LAQVVDDIGTTLCRDIDALESFRFAAAAAKVELHRCAPQTRVAIVGIGAGET
jgi:hypothetical protein